MCLHRFDIRSQVSYLACKFVVGGLLGGFQCSPHLGNPSEEKSRQKPSVGLSVMATTLPLYFTKGTFQIETCFLIS